MLGPSSVASLYRHALGYLANRWPEHPHGSFVDLGSGAGVPGIPLALELTASRWLLVDASERRCELAARAVTCMGLDERVQVLHSRIGELARCGGTRESFHGATVRCFGRVAELAECGLPLLRDGGELVASVNRRTRLEWATPDLLAKTGCELSSTWHTPEGAYIAVRRRDGTPATLPRRAAARRRSPLL